MNKKLNQCLTVIIFLSLMISISKLIISSELDKITIGVIYVFSSVLSLFIILYSLYYIQIKKKIDLFHGIDIQRKIASKRMFYIYLKWLQQEKTNYEVVTITMPIKSKELSLKVLNSILDDYKFMACIDCQKITIALKKNILSFSKLKNKYNLAINRQLHITSC